MQIETFASIFKYFISSLKQSCECFYSSSLVSGSTRGLQVIKSGCTRNLLNIGLSANLRVSKNDSPPVVLLYWKPLFGFSIYF